MFFYRFVSLVYRGFSWIFYSLFFSLHLIKTEFAFEPRNNFAVSPNNGISRDFVKVENIRIGGVSPRSRIAQTELFRSCTYLRRVPDYNWNKWATTELIYMRKVIAHVRKSHFYAPKVCRPINWANPSQTTPCAKTRTSWIRFSIYNVRRKYNNETARRPFIRCL